MRDVHIAQNYREAQTLLAKATRGCLADDIPEVVSLGKTLKRWRTEILARHSTGASNGRTEGLNLCVKKVKRAGHGVRCLENSQLRVLLHAGALARPADPTTHPNAPSLLKRVEPASPVSGR